MSADKLTPAQHENEHNEALNRRMSELGDTAHRLLDKRPDLVVDDVLELELNECGKGCFMEDYLERKRAFYLAFVGTRGDDGGVSFGIKQASSRGGVLDIQVGTGEQCILEYPKDKEHLVSLIAGRSPDTNQWSFSEKLTPKRRARILGRVANICDNLLSDDAMPGDNFDY